MSEALWRIDEVLAATGGSLKGEATSALNGVAIDSRSIELGDIFVAIIGERQDGHNFITQAFENGAGLALVSKPDEKMIAAGPLVVVDDTLKALEALGRHARMRTRAHIVAITGSVGKTSTKDMLHLALSRSGKTHYSRASYNNQWGVPLSLARMPSDSQFGIFEVGMNHPGEIAPLVAMIRPEIAIITTVEPVHIGFFKSIEEIAEAKAEIFGALNPQGGAILNRDNAHFELLKTRAEQAGIKTIIGFGSNENAQIRLLDMALNNAGSCVRADIMGEEVAYKITAPGAHFVMNSLAVLAAVKVLGGDLALGALALAEVKPGKGRGARHVFAKGASEITLIDESYNANPASMRAGLAVLGNADKKAIKRRIALLGDMLELGEQAPKLHADLAGPIAKAGIDLVYACGPQMKHLWENLPDSVKGIYAANSADLVSIVSKELRPGDMIMVKGSLGSAMNVLVEDIKAHLEA